VAVIYTIHYDNVPIAIGGVMGYTGSSRRDLAPDDPYFAHDGSMTPRGKRRMHAAHDRLGVKVARRVEIWWQGPDDNTLVQRELEMLSALRRNDPRYGFNLMPQLVGVNIAVKLDWTHNPDTHVDSTSPASFAFAVFHKGQSSRTTDGMCSYRAERGRHHCAGAWGDADPTHSAKARYPDGREQALWWPGCRGNVFKACIDHKEEMLTELGLNIP
jgi:hypothetical protein